MTRAVQAWIFGAALVMGGCGGEPLSGPPDLRLGRVECAECGMIVSEDRYSSAMLVERRGRREHISFDDIGCMLDLEREHRRTPTEGLVILERFVHDHESRAWVVASGASFLLADRERLATPMGSGIAAFASRDGAESARAEFGGDVMDFEQLKVARENWMLERYGPRSDPK